MFAGGVLLVAVGGALGASLRYGLGLLLLRLGIGGFFPLLCTNGLGALIAGGLVAWPGLSERSQLFVLVGVLGAFTTFSAYGVALLKHMLVGRWGGVLLEVLAQNLLGLMMVLLGYRVVRFFF